MTTRLDIIIPVYNEGRHIVRVLESLRLNVHSPFRVFICYDFDEDDTLAALSGYSSDLQIHTLRSQGRGPLDAVLTGFAASDAPAVLMYPADDDYNAGRIDPMLDELGRGRDIVAASRFMQGGSMVGCPLVKALLIRSSALALHRLAGVPTHDPSNGFRLFSRRVIDRIPVESKVGFAYSLELLVKCHRLKWPIGEVPVAWHERAHGQSRFRILRWLPTYLKWFFYAFATTYLRRSPRSVELREAAI